MYMAYDTNVYIHTCIYNSTPHTRNSIGTSIPNHYLEMWASLLRWRQDPTIPCEAAHNLA